MNLTRMFVSKEVAKEYLLSHPITQGLGNIYYRTVSYKVYFWSEETGKLIEIDSEDEQLEDEEIKNLVSKKSS
jgi:hypothetical protein